MRNSKGGLYTKIDFSHLDNLAYTEFTPVEDTVAENSSKSQPQRKRKTAGGDTTTAQNATESHTGDESAQAKVLQLHRDQRKPALDQTAPRKYQENILRSGTLPSDILKGLAEGEDIYSLFLKAVQAIALMTNDNQILKQAQGDIEVIYGVGQEQKEPLQLQLEAVERRLFNLEESLLWYTEPDEQRRLHRAIEAHQRRAEKLRELIKKIA